MKYFALSLALFVASALSAQAAEPVSLQAVGLSGMKVMSDVQGNEIRAKGFVFGQSTATSTQFVALAGPGAIVVNASTASSTNGYENLKFFSPAFGASVSAANANVGGGGSTALSGGFSFTN